MHTVQFSRDGWVRLVFLWYLRETHQGVPEKPTRCQILAAVFKAAFLWGWHRSLGYEILGAPLYFGLLFGVLLSSLATLFVWDWQLIPLVLVAASIILTVVWLVTLSFRLVSRLAAWSAVKDTGRLIKETFRQIKDGSLICPFVEFDGK